MQRRNFLKGIFTAYAIGSGYFSFKYLSSQKKNAKGFDVYDKNISIDDTNQQRLEVVEIPIVYHCNLNCAYCDHFAPIAPKFQVPLEEFNKDIEKLAAVTKGKIGTIWLLGGEPLLHDKITDIIKIINKHLPKTNIAMTTNGLLLDKQSDEFWKTCFKYKVTIMVENYVLNKDNVNFDKIYEKLKDYNCNLHVNVPKYEFRQTNLSKEKKYNIAQRYNKCKCHKWHMFDRGKFYSCPTINGVEKFFNKKFPNNAIAIDENDILDIHKINSIKEIIDFYNKPKSFCAHCGYYKNKQWRLSERKADEWYQG